MLTDNWSFSSQKETYLWSSEPNPTPAMTAVQKEYDTLFLFVYFLFWVKFFDMDLELLNSSLIHNIKHDGIVEKKEPIHFFFVPFRQLNKYS